MDAEKVTGFVCCGQYCIWCNYFYPDSYFRQTIDVCQPFDNFHMKHNYDQGNFLVCDVMVFDFVCLLQWSQKSPTQKLMRDLRA